jgi:hypothetical protein
MSAIVEGISIARVVGWEWARASGELYLLYDDESLLMRNGESRAPAFLEEIAVIHVAGYLVDITGCDRCERGVLFTEYNVGCS